MKKIVLTGAMLLVCLAATGQQATTSQPASKADFASAIRTLDSAMSKRLTIKPLASTSAATGQVTRKEVAAKLIELMKHYQPKFRVTPRPFDVYPEVIDQFNKDATIRTDLRILSRWGLIGPVGPLVSNKSDAIGEEELGDSLGFFYAHIAYLTHQPDPRWTPNLSDGE